MKTEIDRPDIIRFQPHPMKVRVLHLRVEEITVTTILRQWKSGDSARCRLCERCTAHEDTCLVLLDGYVSHDEAPAFTTRDLKRQEPRG